MSIRLLIADDHPLVLAGLDDLFRTTTDVEVVARCSSGEQVLPAIETSKPDVVLLDKQMPGRDGMAILRDLQSMQNPPRAVLLTASMSEDDMLEALRRGAHGVVLKNMPPRLLVDCVRKVARGEQWLEKESLGRAIDKLLKREAAEQEVRRLLTPRELEIVRMAASGLRNSEIGARTFISEGTVRSHLYNIFQKLKVRNRTELSAFARDKGIV
jgi:two-component system, NarL family, nitrate/nitrite response regulator NarL